MQTKESNEELHVVLLLYKSKNISVSMMNLMINVLSPEKPTDNTFIMSRLHTILEIV